MSDLDNRLTDEASSDSVRYKIIDVDLLEAELENLYAKIEQVFSIIKDIEKGPQISELIHSIRSQKIDLLNGCECPISAKRLPDGLTKAEYQKIGDNYKEGPLYRPLKFAHRKCDVRYVALTAYDYYKFFYRPLVLRKVINLGDINQWDPTLYKTLLDEGTDFHDF